MNAKELESVFEQYKTSCYGNSKLSDIQYREVRQAFLSGIHWLNSLCNYKPFNTFPTEDKVRVLESLGHTLEELDSNSESWVGPSREIEIMKEAGKILNEETKDKVKDFDSYELTKALHELLVNRQ